jgi:hypothetical protein
VIEGKIAPVTVFLSEETDAAEVRARRDRFAPLPIVAGVRSRSGVWLRRPGVASRSLTDNPLDIVELD